jgi:hypothetical protein
MPNWGEKCNGSLACGTGISPVKPTVLRGLDGPATSRRSTQFGQSIDRLLRRFDAPQLLDEFLGGEQVLER